MYIDSFLNKLSDIELAYFYQYRFNEFIPDTQHKIDNELIKRNIDKRLIPEKIKNHTFNINIDSLFCPFCGSEKYTIEKYKVQKYYGKGFIAEVEREKFICNVCNYQNKFNFFFQFLKRILRLKKKLQFNT